MKPRRSAELCVVRLALLRQLYQPFRELWRRVLAFCLRDVWPVVMSLPALHHIGRLAHHVGQRRYVARLAAHDVEPRRFLGFVAPPLLRRFQRPAAVLVALTRPRQLLRLPERRACRVFQYPAKLPHQSHRQPRQVHLVGPRPGERPQPAPCPARRVRHHWASARPAPRVAVGVPHVAVWQRLVGAVGAGEEHGNRHRSSPPDAQPCGAVDLAHKAAPVH